jgi:predicted ATPase
MLKRLYVDNYRCLVNFELLLHELTLLLGPNGVGKTSVLDVIFAIRQLLSGTAKVTDFTVFPESTLTKWQTRPIQTFVLEADLDDEHYEYRLEVQHERPQPQQARRARVWKEHLTGNGGPLFSFFAGDVQLYRDDHSEGPKFPADWSESALARVAPRGDNERLSRFLDFMRKIVVCGLYPASFESETRAEDPMLNRDARNFASWYLHVLLERQDLVPTYMQSLKDVIDGFRGIRLEKVGQDTRALVVQFDADESPYELRFDEISDGQRALIALYALVHLTAGQKYTLFLDEPDNYIALPEIQPWLVAMSGACGEAVPQAVLCSHHPELIDYLGGDCGLLLSRESDGVTTARSIETKGIEPGLKLSELVARGWER